LKLNLKLIIELIKEIGKYILPLKRIKERFLIINNDEQLKKFIQERSAHVTQTTLYGYVKTRIGSRHALLFEDKEFSKSIEIAKWNIYVVAIADCLLYTLSYLLNEKKIKKIEPKKIYFEILDDEKKNGLPEKNISDAKIEFEKRIEQTNLNNYYSDKPFQMSSNALYEWAPIAENLKVLDKEIVINSINLKWNLVENEFKNLVSKVEKN